MKKMLIILLMLSVQIIKSAEVSPIDANCEVFKHGIWFNNIDKVKSAMKNGYTIKKPFLLEVMPRVKAGKLSLEIFEELTKNADLETINFQQKDFRGGRTPLIFAVEMRLKEVVELLIKSQANLNLQDNIGDTALIKAAKIDCSDSLQSNLDGDILKLLLQHKAHLNIKNKEGKIAFQIAEENRHKSIYYFYKLSILLVYTDNEKRKENFEQDLKENTNFSNQLINLNLEYV